ncbi:hypothetical protein [Actinomadura fibrosa]|uniref:Uncharacterized protein n=1 Tax=Actinomadura fibrosa TaxID=111802 RepID=A0ABW2Y288_9ACTN|nr:hypothetical protein [Actinomadura fibrosa]
MSNQHPDPITEGFLHSGQRLVQIVTMATAVQQGCVRRMTRLRIAEQARDEEARRAEEQARRAEAAEARSRWGRAHDPTWLRRADLLDVADTWGAAVPYATGNTSASSAVRKCEQRLREIHPHAMSHYDRLRSEGQEELVAMANAAPFFARDPNVRTGEPVSQREELSEGTGFEWAATVHGPHRGEWEQARQEQRARAITAALGDRQHSQGGREPEPGDLRAVLEATTNLPDEVITKVVPASGAARRPGPAEQVRLAAEGFPMSVEDALQAAAEKPSNTPSARRTHDQTPDRNRRRNL